MTLADPPVRRRPSPPAVSQELWDSLGRVPLDRIVLDPPPGTVTFEDYVALDGRLDDRLVELVDETLVEKPMGRKESRIALKAGRLLGNAIDAAGRGGKLSGEAGTIRMAGGSQVRMPDVCWTAPEDVTDPEEREAVPQEPPTLAVEVISESNTEAEMAIKLTEYFASGCRLAWLLYPKTRTVRAYTSPDAHRELSADDTLDGGDVLPGFAVRVGDLFDV